MAQNYGLGKGLASLIPKKSIPADADASGSVRGSTSNDGSAPPNDVAKTEEKKSASVAQEADIASVDSNPHQPRVAFDEEKLKDLTQSIKQHGIIQPLVVSKNNDRYELIAGERRFQAAKRAGLQKVPIVVREVKEKEKLELALVENIQRHDLNPVEEARAYKKLADDFQMGQVEIAVKIGKSRPAIANKIRLLGLPIEIQKSLISGKISEGHAKAILALENPEKQRALFDLIIKNKLTVRQTEDKTKEVSVRAHKRTISVDPEIKDLENKLVGILGTKVKVIKSGGGGKIVIEYYSEEELNNIIQKLETKNPERGNNPIGTIRPIS